MKMHSLLPRGVDEKARTFQRLSLISPTSSDERYSLWKWNCVESCDHSLSLAALIPAARMEYSLALGKRDRIPLDLEWTRRESVLRGLRMGSFHTETSTSQFCFFFFVYLRIGYYSCFRYYSCWLLSRYLWCIFSSVHVTRNMLTQHPR